MIKAGAALLLAVTAAAGADVLRVPSQYPTIKAAITAAVSGDTVLIADGVYRGTGNVGLNFLGKAITVKSENGPAACIIDAARTGVIVTFNSMEGPGSVLEGITLKDATNPEGGGIHCNRSSPTIRGCVFEACWGSYHSSGVGCIQGSAPRIEDCLFTGGLAGVGGAVHALTGSHPKLIGCTISGHRTDLFGAGGAGCDATSSLTIDRCTFTGNQAIGFAPYGGAVFISGGTATITNSLFVDNTSGYGGGAIAASNGARVTVVNCTFAANHGAQGGGAIWSTNSSPDVANCIMWGNIPDQVGVGTGAPAVVNHSLVEGGWPGNGNLRVDPRFVGPGDYRLAPDSPCIDAGDVGTLPAGIGLDLDGNPRRVDDPATPDTGVGPVPIVDMGAYEFQAAACYANCDGSTVPPILNVADFVCFQTRFAAGDPSANCDGSTVPPVLNVADFVCFQTAFAGGCP